MISLKIGEQHIWGARVELIRTLAPVLSSKFRMDTSTVFSNIPSFLDWHKIRRLILELENEEP